MSNQKYFDVPFGFSGDVTPIPDPLQVGGSVSFTEGWNFNYQRDLATDPAALSIDRSTMNWLLLQITTALQALQQETVPEWILASQNAGAAISYGLGSVVLYSTSGNAPFTKFVSLVAANVATPSTADPLGATTGWQVVCDPIATGAQAAAGTNNASIMTPLLVAQQTALRALLAGSGSQVFNVAPATQPAHAVQAAQVQTGSLTTAVAGGTANALTATFAASSSSLVNGQPLTLIAAAANTSTVTAVITLGTTALASLPIVKGSDQPLAPGDIPGAGYPIELNYSTTYGALVMQNPGTGVLGVQALPRNYIAGLILSNDATNPTVQIDIAPGQAVDSTNSVVMNLSAVLVKTMQNSGGWAAGTNASGLFSGVRAASTWYHVFEIFNPTTGAVDAGFDTSIIAANRPAAFTRFRRIGSVLTDSSGNIRTFNQYDDEFNWVTPVQDINVSGQGPGTGLYPLTVPPGLRVRAIVQGIATSSVGSAQISINVPGQNDNINAPTALTPGASSFIGVGRVCVYSNTAQQIQLNTTLANTSYEITAYGWIDSRGKNS